MNARAHAWGFYFDVPVVSSQIKEHVRQFRSRPGNPTAAGQADVIAHSMGRPVTRAILGLVDYTGADSFGQGSIHKLITIGTPHYGTRVAADLLNSPCVINELAKKKLIVFSTVTIPGLLSPINGAVADLMGDGVGVATSDAIQHLDNPLPLNPSRPNVPTAMIAAAMLPSNAAGLDVCNASDPKNCSNRWLLRHYCLSDALAQRLTASAWQSEEFQNEANDGIVPVSSQLRNPAGITPITGVVHSRGTNRLGFNSPFGLSPEPAVPIYIQQTVVRLLNSSVTDRESFQALP
jgi:hypothetical protein